MAVRLGLVDPQLAQQVVYALLEFVGERAGFGAVADDVGRNEDDELGALILLRPGAKELPENGQVHEEGNAASGLALGVRDDAADDDRLAAVYDDRRLGLAGRKRRRDDAFDLQRGARDV